MRRRIALEKESGDIKDAVEMANIAEQSLVDEVLREIGKCGGNETAALRIFEAQDGRVVKYEGQSLLRCVDLEVMFFTRDLAALFVLGVLDAGFLELGDFAVGHCFVFQVLYMLLAFF